MAQKNESPRIVPLIEELPTLGMRSPVCLGSRSTGWVAKWKIKNRNALDTKRAVVDGGVSAHFHDDLVRVELPLGTRQLARGDGSVVNQVVVGPGLLHHSAGKGKRILGGQDHPLPAQLHARRPYDMFEAPRFGPDVVGGMRSLDMLVVQSAIEHNVAVRDRLSGVGVIVD